MMEGKRSKVTEEDSGKQLINRSNREKDIVFSVKIEYKKDVPATDSHQGTQINPENENVPGKKKSIKNVAQNFLRLEIDKGAEVSGQETEECKAGTSAIYSSKAIRHIKDIDGGTNMNIINGGVKNIGDNDQTNNDKMNINFSGKCSTSNVHNKRSSNSSPTIESDIVSNQNFEKNALQLKCDVVRNTYFNTVQDMSVEGNWQITPKGSICLDEGMDEEVVKEINHVINSSEEDQMQFGFNNHVNISCGLTVNTPATELTDRHFQTPSRTPLREKYYDHALMLMNCRCKSGSRYLTSAGMTQCLCTTSGNQAPIVSLPSLVGCINDPPFSCNPNSHFYVTQRIQQKASIFKAWKGYHGNVYFEPFTCKQLDIADSFDRCSKEYTKSVDKSKSTRIQLPNLEKRTQSRVSFASDTVTENSVARKTESRSVRNGKNKPSSSVISQSMRQMSILDKRSIMKRSNSKLREDMDWISSQESTGSLCIGHQPQQQTTSAVYNDSNKHYKLKICHGIASQSFEFNEQPPILSLNGERFNKQQIKYSSERKLSTDGSSEFYQYDASTQNSILDGSRDNKNRLDCSVLHVVPSPNQAISRKLNIKDTSFQITFSQ